MHLLPKVENHPFRLKNKGYWQRLIKNCKEPYRLAEIEYAAYWAHLSEKLMAQNGQELEAVLFRAGLEADKERLVYGKMIDNSARILEKAWFRGTRAALWYASLEGKRFRETLSAGDMITQQHHGQTQVA